MNWDQPFDITETTDGTYLKNGKAFETRPRWTIGTPRGYLALLVQGLVHLWDYLEPLQSQLANNIVFAILAGITVWLYVSAWRAWENY